MTNHLFCFGLGYSSLNLAEQLLADGWRVSGTTRTAQKCDELRPKGITSYIFDTDLPLQNIWDLSTVTHLLISIPPGASGDIVLSHHMHEIMKLPNLKWVGYLSTTGVYGNHDGGFVDETTPVKPSGERTQKRVLAEEEWLTTNLPVHIFRLSGIYGKGRSAIDSLRDGSARRIKKDGHKFSRIHVDDIANILIASINNPTPSEIFNCADDEPAEQPVVIEYAAKLLGIEPPAIVPFEEAELSEMARSFYMDNRQIKNNKIKEKLGVLLKYPTFREGLKACL